MQCVYWCISNLIFFSRFIWFSSSFLPYFCQLKTLHSIYFYLLFLSISKTIEIRMTCFIRLQVIALCGLINLVPTNREFIIRIFFFHIDNINNVADSKKNVVKFYQTILNLIVKFVQHSHFHKIGRHIRCNVTFNCKITTFLIKIK